MAMLFVVGCSSNTDKDKTTDLEDKGLYGPVKSVIMIGHEAIDKFGHIEMGDADGGMLWCFNEQGMMTSQTEYDRKGDTKNTTIFEYNEMGLLAKITTTDRYGEEDNVMVYRYKGELLDSVIQNDPSKWNYSINKYYYDDNNNLVKRTYITANDSNTYVEEKKDGKIVKCIETDRTGKEINVTTYEYVEGKISHEKSTLWGEVFTEYNEYYHPIKITKDKEIVQFEYEYDEHHNWVKAKVSDVKNNKVSGFIIREIEYFK